MIGLILLQFSHDWQRQVSVNSDIVARLFGGLVGAAGFATVGWTLAGYQDVAAPLFVVAGSLIGLLVGLIITPA